MKETCEKQLMTTTKGMGLERETRVAWRGRILRLPTTLGRTCRLTASPTHYRSLPPHNARSLVPGHSRDRPNTFAPNFLLTAAVAEMPGAPPPPPTRLYLSAPA